MTDYEQLRNEVEEVPQVNGIVPVDILNLPQPLARLVRGLVRDKTISAAELAGELEITVEQATGLADSLIEKGYFLAVQDDVSEQDGDVCKDEMRRYRIRFARMRKHNIPLDL